MSKKHIKQNITINTLWLLCATTLHAEQPAPPSCDTICVIDGTRMAHSGQTSPLAKTSLITLSSSAGVLWLVTDEDPALLYSFNTQTLGVGVWRIPGDVPTRWDALTSGPCSIDNTSQRCIFLASLRDELDPAHTPMLSRIPEPDPNTQNTQPSDTAPPTTFTITLPAYDGVVPQPSAIAAHPSSGTIYIAAGQETRSLLFSLTLDDRAAEPPRTLLRTTLPIPRLTALAISPNGAHIAAANDSALYEHRILNAQEDRLPTALATPDGKSYPLTEAYTTRAIAYDLTISEYLYRDDTYQTRWQTAQDLQKMYILGKNNNIHEWGLQCDYQQANCIYNYPPEPSRADMGADIGASPDTGDGCAAAGGAAPAALAWLLVPLLGRRRKHNKIRDNRQ